MAEEPGPHPENLAPGLHPEDQPPPADPEETPKQKKARERKEKAAEEKAAKEKTAADKKAKAQEEKAAKDKAAADKKAAKDKAAADKKAADKAAKDKAAQEKKDKAAQKKKEKEEQNAAKKSKGKEPADAVPAPEPEAEPANQPLPPTDDGLGPPQGSTEPGALEGLPHDAASTQPLSHEMPGPPPAHDALTQPPSHEVPAEAQPPGHHEYDHHVEEEHAGGYKDAAGQWIADGGGYYNEHNEFVPNPETAEGHFEGTGDDSVWIETPTAIAPAYYHHLMGHQEAPPPAMGHQEVPPPAMGVASPPTMAALANLSMGASQSAQQAHPPEGNTAHAAAAANVLSLFGNGGAAPAHAAFGGHGGLVASSATHEDIDHTQGAVESVTFADQGVIGLTLVKRTRKDSGKEAMVIDRITPGKQADKMPQLRPGLILKSVNGNDVEHLSVADVTAIMKNRPVTCDFVYRAEDTQTDGYLYGAARSGAMNMGFAARMHRKAQHAKSAVDINHQMLDHTAEDEIIEAVLTEPGPLGFKVGDHKSPLDGSTYLVITSIRPGSQAARLAPQVTEGLFLKEVNGRDVVNWPTNDVMGLLASRPLFLKLVRINNGSGGEADPEVTAKLKMELVQTKKHLQTVEDDGHRVLEHMYHLEEELDKTKGERKQLSADLSVAKDTVRQLDEGHAELLQTLHQTQSQLSEEKDAKAQVEYENTELRKRLALLADHFETTKAQLGEQVDRVTHAFEMEKEAHSHTQSELDITKRELDRAIEEHGAAIASERFYKSQYELAGKLRAQSIAKTASRHAESVSGTPRSFAGGGAAAGVGSARPQYASSTVPGMETSRVPGPGMSTRSTPSYDQI